MMSLISPRHGLHHVAQKLRKTGWPRRCDKVTVSPANVLSEKSGATASRPWAEGRAVAMTSTTHKIPSGRKPAPGSSRTDLSFHVGGEQVKVYISAPSSEKWNDDFRSRPARTRLRRDAAPRCVVDRTRADGARARQLRHLRHVGRLGRQKLRMGTIPVAVLLAADPDLVVAAVTRVPDSDFPRRIPRHLLLLSQSVLPRVLPRSRRVWRGRAAPRVQGRDQIPLHSPERAPLFPVRRGGLHLHSLVRRLPRHPLARERRAHRWSHGPGTTRVWRRHRHPRDGGQRDSPGRLHVRLSLAATSDRRERGLLLLRTRRASSLPTVARRHRTQR